MLPSIGCDKCYTLRFLSETSYISTCAAIHWMGQMSHLETFTWDILHKHLCCHLLDVTNDTPWYFYMRHPTWAPVLPYIGCDKCHTLRFLPETSYISTCAAIYWMWQMSHLKILPETSYISTCAAIYWMWQMLHLEIFIWDLLHKDLCCHLLDVTNVASWDIYLRLPS